MTEAPDMQQVNQLIDREAIRSVIHQYSRGCDRREWELARSAFHEDAYGDYGTFKGGRDDFISWLKSRHDAGHVEQSMHLLGDIHIDFLARDIAIVETCVRAIQRYTAEAVEARLMFDIDDDVAGEERIRVDVAHRYVDRFDRREGRWAIARRVVVYEDVEVTRGAPPVFGQGWDVASRDRSDTIWRMLENDQ